MNKHLIVLGMVVLLICVGLSGCIGTNYSSSDSDNWDTEPIQYKSWHFVDGWAENEGKTTNSFHITGETLGIQIN